MGGGIIHTLLLQCVVSYSAFSRTGSCFSPLGKKLCDSRSGEVARLVIQFTVRPPAGRSTFVRVGVMRVPVQVSLCPLE